MPVIRFVLPVVAFISSLGVPAAILAQTTPAPAVSAAPAASPAHHHHHRSFMHALRDLNLTPAQQQQVTAFHDAEQKANLNADPATKKANGAKMRGQIMGILTPDQKAQLASALHHPGVPAPVTSAAPAAH